MIGRKRQDAAEPKMGTGQWARKGGVVMSHKGDRSRDGRVGWGACWCWFWGRRGRGEGEGEYVLCCNVLLCFAVLSVEAYGLLCLCVCACMYE